MGFLSWLFSKGARGGSTTETARSAPAAAVVWRPGSFPIEVVGESHYQAALAALCGEYKRAGHEVEADAQLKREPSNPHDPNAVAVLISNQKVGYLPRDQAKRLVDEMNWHRLSVARCRAKIVGGWRTNQYDEGGFGVRLAIPGLGAIDFGDGKLRPQEGGTQRTSASREPGARPAPAGHGPLVGHRVAIMGAASDGPEARQLAQAGAKIVAGIGKTTTMLVVVGEEPFGVGIRRSRSFQLAEELIAKGSHIRIVSWTAAQKLAGPAS